MTRESHEYTVRHFFQIVDSGEISRLKNVLSPDLVLHVSTVPEPLSYSAAMPFYGALATAFPCPRHDIRSLTTGDGRTVAQVMFTGTHGGEFQGIPATGNAVALPVTNTFRLDRGKIAEHWIELDMADLMRQIGAGAPSATNGALAKAYRPFPSAQSSNGHSAAETNRALVRRVYDEVINQEKASVIGEVFAADAVIHDPLTGTSQGAAAFAQLLGMFDAAFPHHRVTVDQVIADGGYVGVLHTHIATHTGSFMGRPPTGKSVVVNGLELFRVVDGRIVEFWRKDDDVSLLMQLGFLPAPVTA